MEEPESGYEIIAKTAEAGKRFNRKFQQSACFLRKFVKQIKVIKSKDSTIIMYLRKFTCMYGSNKNS